MKRLMIIAAGIVLGSIIAVAGKAPTPAYMHFNSDGSGGTVRCGGSHARHGLDYIVGTCS